jgi:hypothetical protein
MTAMTADPFAKFKEVQREGWSSFVPVEIMTTTPAGKLVKFAQVKAGQHVLDVACGTGVVAITAARRAISPAPPPSTQSSLKATLRRCLIPTNPSTSCSASSATSSRRVPRW